MDTEKPIWPDRLELAVRAMLGLALLAGVAWAWTDGTGMPASFDFGSLWG